MRPQYKLFMIIVGCLIGWQPVFAYSKLDSQLQCYSKQVGIDKLNVILNKNIKKQYSQVYFIKNISNQPLIINHQAKQAAAKAGWASQIMPGHWSVLAVAKKNFDLSCGVNSATTFHFVDCSKVISICQNQSFLSIDSKADYWLVENKSYVQALKLIRK